MHLPNKPVAVSTWLSARVKLLSVFSLVHDKSMHHFSEMCCCTAHPSYPFPGRKDAGMDALISALPGACFLRASLLLGMSTYALPQS